MHLIATLINDVLYSVSSDLILPLSKFIKSQQLCSSTPWIWFSRTKMHFNKGSKIL